MDQRPSHAAGRTAAQAHPAAQTAGVGRPWPQGAITGLLMVALGCAAIVIASYRLFGPSEAFASDEPMADWSAIESSAAAPHGA